MAETYLIGLDFGSLSARGVLVDVATGRIVDDHTHAYRHGIMSERLPNGVVLPAGWALQCATDYTEAALAILQALGGGRQVQGIGLGFTASTPLPARADGTPLSSLYPDRPHAYVKLWKHQAAQPWADRINAAGGEFLKSCGGRVSAEWLLAKAAQLAEEAPDLWAATDRFIEGGDWLVWRLTGQEVRSLSFATFKAQYRPGEGYPAGVVPGLADRLREPFPLGHAAGGLGEDWRARTGILGPATVATAVIDSHVVMPALGATQPGTLVGALGTSAAFLLLDSERRPLPAGVEGMSQGGTLPGFQSYESGQAAFGDVLAWFVRSFPYGDSEEAGFAYYNAAASRRTADQSHLVALDWWNGCRVPLSDSLVSGLIVGLTLRTTPVEIYRALMESLCYGTRTIVEHLEASGVRIARIVLTSGLARGNPFLMQLMADILGRTVHVPELQHATALAAAIHGAVAAGVVQGFDEGASRYGARRFRPYLPDPAATGRYGELYACFRTLSGTAVLRDVMHVLRRGG